MAAGFVSWAILQAKELTMAIADWIREATEKRRRRIFAEVVQSEAYRQKYAEGFRQGYDEAYLQRYGEGFRQGLVEGYDMGYDDADRGRPRRWPPMNGGNGDGDDDGGG